MIEIKNNFVRAAAFLAGSGLLSGCASSPFENGVVDADAAISAADSVRKFQCLTGTQTKYQQCHDVWRKAGMRPRR